VKAALITRTVSEQIAPEKRVTFDGFDGQGFI
jgi:hypothetical protein